MDLQLELKKLNNMQKLRLLDLNEGKILELGKDFLYGREFIAFFRNKTIFQHEVINKTPPSQSTHTKLIPFLEKTGAELFGDRYVLVDKDKAFIYKDIYSVKDLILNYCDKEENKYSLYLNYDFCCVLALFLQRRELREYALNPSEKNKVWFIQQFRVYPFFNLSFENKTIEEIDDILKKQQLNKDYSKNNVCLYNEIKDNYISIVEFFQKYSLLLKGEPNKFDEFCKIICQ